MKTSLRDGTDEASAIGVATAGENEKAASFTPGPWHVDPVADDWDGPIDVVSEMSELGGLKCANWIAECDLQDGRRDENHANARLIAAAPDLLACLRRMCGMYGAYSKRLAPLLAEDEGTIWTFERANDLACEAIVKAEGR